jgi:hypothetical protein
MQNSRRVGNRSPAGRVVAVAGRPVLGRGTRKAGKREARQRRTSKLGDRIVPAEIREVLHDGTDALAAHRT